MILDRSRKIISQTGLAKKADAAAQDAKAFKDLRFEEFSSTQRLILAPFELSFDDDHA
jgi:hypothetical protein